jgi:hypothetical protein
LTEAAGAGCVEPDLPLFFIAMEAATGAFAQ